jgi:hypothetical protein
MTCWGSWKPARWVLIFAKEGGWGARVELGLECLVALFKVQDLRFVSIVLACSWLYQSTFFCSRTTLVHFFSKMPSYFFLVASSKVEGMLASSRSAAAVLGALMTPRYASTALCLPLHQYGLRVYRACFSHSSSACRSVRRALILGAACSCTSANCHHHAQQK